MDDWSLKLLDARVSCEGRSDELLSNNFREYMGKMFSEGVSALRVAGEAGYIVRCAEEVIGHRSTPELEQNIKTLLDSDSPVAEKLENIANYLDDHDKLGLQDKIADYSLIPFETTQDYLSQLSTYKFENELDSNLKQEESRTAFELIYRNTVFGYLYRLSESLVFPKDTVAQTTEESGDSPSDEALYEKVWNEIEEGQTDVGLWAKLLVENDGDESKTKVAYLKTRVARLSQTEDKESVIADEPVAKEDVQVQPIETTAQTPVWGFEPEVEPEPEKPKPSKIDMALSVDPWDEFFIEQIVRGLDDRQALSEDELVFLLKPADQLSDSESISPDEARTLNNKCVHALTISYKRMTSGKNKKSALLWNKYNEEQYKHSKCFVSGIVQNWYLSVGRPMEKKVVSLLGKPDW